MAFNPELGSTSPAVLLDNAERLDKLVNGPAADVPDRGGDPLYSWRQMMAKNDEVRQNLIPLSKQYMTLAAAQADIANIPVGSTTYYRSPDNSALAIEVMNVGGTLQPTGRKMPSQGDIDNLTSIVQIINSLFSKYAPAGFSLTFNDDTGNFSVAIKDDGTLAAGAVETNQITSSIARLNTIVSTLISAEGDRPTMDSAFAVEFHDALYNICVAIDSTGRLLAGGATIQNLTAGVNLNLPDGSYFSLGGVQGFKLSLADIYQQLCFAIKDDGTLAAGNTELNSLSVSGDTSLGDVTSTSIITGEIKSPSVFNNGESKTLKFKFLSDIIHILSFGQSLSTGVNGTPVQTIDELYNAVKFNGGVRAQDGGEDPAITHASFLPYTETIQDTGNGTGYETPVAGCIKMIYDLTVQENHGFSLSDMAILGSAPGQGGKTIGQLSNTAGIYMPRVRNDISYGLALSQSSGKTYSPEAVMWIQGETDQSNGTTKDAYIDYYDRMVSKINEYASEVMGEKRELPWFTYQFSSWINRAPNNAYPTIPMALLELAKTRDDTVMVCPMYIFDYYDDAHLTGPGYKEFGAYMGIAIKRTIFDGIPFEPLWPISHIRQGRVINIKFNPVGKLVLDTSFVSDPGNFGFSIVDSDGAEIAITSVSVRFDTVSVVAASDVTDGAKLRYAFIGGTHGQKPDRTQGPRGCLRDSQGDTIIFDPDGLNRRMDNYCTMFEIEI
ncbi:TPA: hypothetical protein ACN74O_003140 [Klebsiella pneumoniae]